MFKFFNKKGETVFSSDSFEEVEEKAIEYKEKHKLSSLAICKKNGQFYKWS